MAVNSFPKTRRMCQARQFAQVFAHPCKVGDNEVTILARLNALHYPRLGLVVSKRSARAAVDRNRIKRLAREAFRHLQDRLGGVDVIVMSRSGLAARDNVFIATLLTKYLSAAAKRCVTSSSG